MGREEKLAFAQPSDSRPPTNLDSARSGLQGHEISDRPTWRFLQSSSHAGPRAPRSYFEGPVPTPYEQAYVIVDALNVCRFVRDDAVPQQATSYGCATGSYPRRNSTTFGPSASAGVDTTQLQ
ncbi:unnamed protein product [Heligmosomoides polygyrus]|uniref:RNase NYN domain-containing protein n=1 Tax=Heligmosomoides polygyrus TaxID=6339 RepID=A0A183GLI9_HELPZ|nr:unnamed protein product [Heligmosomoides polygyrus]